LQRSPDYYYCFYYAEQVVVAVNVAENCTINGEKPAEYGGKKKNENKFATH